MSTEISQSLYRNQHTLYHPFHVPQAVKLKIEGSIKYNEQIPTFTFALSSWITQKKCREINFEQFIARIYHARSMTINKLQSKLRYFLLTSYSPFYNVYLENMYLRLQYVLSVFNTLICSYICSRRAFSACSIAEHRKRLVRHVETHITPTVTSQPSLFRFSHRN